MADDQKPTVSCDGRCKLWKKNCVHIGSVNVEGWQRTCDEAWKGVLLAGSCARAKREVCHACFSELVWSSHSHTHTHTHTTHTHTYTRTAWTHSHTSCYFSAKLRRCDTLPCLPFTTQTVGGGLSSRQRLKPSTATPLFAEKKYFFQTFQKIIKEKAIFFYLRQLSY